MHSAITDHRCSIPSRISSSVRQACSLASITSLIDICSRAQIASSSSPVLKGNFTWRVVEHDAVGSGRHLVDDEPAADRVVGAELDLRVVPVVRREGHPVGVRGQALAPVHDQVAVDVEADRVSCR